MGYADSYPPVDASWLCWPRLPPPQTTLEKSVSDHILKLSDDDFEEKVLQADGPVLVDYWAEWCGPCKSLAPILDGLARDYAGRLTVAKLNIDDNPKTPQHYGVRGIPTLSLFVNGQVVATKVGALPKSQIDAWLQGYI